MTISAFKDAVWRYYHAHGRHDLPWRKTTDPYKILVSEVMLQQTQVERVIPYYKAFVRKFPTARALARAPLGEVLAVWSGLGYNRRAKLLHEAAAHMQSIQFSSYRTDFVSLVRALEALPGVGPYTARAVAAFAFNADTVFVETNIRTAIIHYFFRGRSDVRDTELVEVLSRLLPKGWAREWYAALMDYGAHLKKSGVRVNARSTHYAKQTKFEGSLRQARGAILAALTRGEPLSAVKKSYAGRFDAALMGLINDRLIERCGRTVRLAS